MRPSLDEPSAWSLETFCASQNSLPEDPWNGLPPTSYAFLQSLELPTRHPFCTNPESLVRPLPPPMGPPSDFQAESLFDAIVTAMLHHAPPLLALAYLLAVLVAIYVSPIGVLFLAWRTFRLPSEHANKRPSVGIEMVLQATLFLSWLVLSDDQYVLGIGRGPGLALMVALMVITAALHQQGRLNLYTGHRILIFFICSYYISPWRLLDPDDIAKVPAGLYYNHNNTVILSIIKNWNVPDYEQIGTAWQCTGDARTGLSYLLNHPHPPIFHRVWLPTEDDEFVALDIAFPESGHDTAKPLYLVLHGLNGGSQEGYVMDLAESRTRAGSTVVVLVARGLMDTPIQGWTVRCEG